MKNKYSNLFIFLAFLPIAVLPLSPAIAAALAIGLILYGQMFQSKSVFKKALNPLTIALLFVILLAGIQIFIQIFTLFGQIIPTTGMNNFVFVMISMFRFLNLILLFALIGGFFIALFAVISGENMPIFGKLIKHFEKEEASQTEDKQSKENDEIIIEEEANQPENNKEVVIEEE